MKNIGFAEIITAFNDLKNFSFFDKGTKQRI